MKKIITAVLTLSFVLLVGCEDADAEAEANTAEKSETTQTE